MRLIRDQFAIGGEDLDSDGFAVTNCRPWDDAEVLRRIVHAPKPKDRGVLATRRSGGGIVDIPEFPPFIYDPGGLAKHQCTHRLQAFEQTLVERLCMPKLEHFQETLQLHCDSVGHD
ncbi:MAG: hypothetical protein COV10_00445 [Candidatus Vogelbacteria bacterium CG10_big_fil_rev_8_21_14_0_10_51_16]|uniref:Uncharacterized protein n=1 Tax=Candidatus Vogelbacteria bacterium CG10_big_fil_rev_8_21_14_0_10_51_16 TaxID=1975045 RepID=A0A2H0RFD1_9BACT|nr:MAG: hypothetical protein COV10_00445 [Candidatus Vogelbacteria bacterium CG10_big_fil_rev_8_21_14_0_10_51_16]